MPGQQQGGSEGKAAQVRAATAAAWKCFLAVAFVAPTLGKEPALAMKGVVAVTRAVAVDGNFGCDLACGCDCDVEDDAGVDVNDDGDVDVGAGVGVVAGGVVGLVA